MEPSAEGRGREDHEGVRHRPLGRPIMNRASPERCGQVLRNEDVPGGFQRMESCLPMGFCSKVAA